MDYISIENTVYMQRLCYRLCLGQFTHTDLDINGARHYPRLNIKAEVRNER